VLAVYPQIREVAMTMFADSDVWDFRKDEHGRWEWRRQSVLGEVIAEGRQHFDDFDQCVADAKRCGYATQSPIGSAADTPEQETTTQVSAR
jgi:hypothetical protein